MKNLVGEGVVSLVVVPMPTDNTFFKLILFFISYFENLLLLFWICSYFQIGYCSGFVHDVDLVVVLHPLVLFFLKFQEKLIFRIRLIS